jgi:hypothetical protein
MGFGNDVWYTQEWVWDTLDGSKTPLDTLKTHMRRAAVDDENMHGIDGEAPPPSYGGVPPCVGACGGQFELTETTKQGCPTLRHTLLISARKARLTYVLLLIMPPNISSDSLNAQTTKKLTQSLCDMPPVSIHWEWSLRGLAAWSMPSSNERIWLLDG